MELAEKVTKSELMTAGYCGVVVLVHSSEENLSLSLDDVAINVSSSLKRKNGSWLLKK